LTFRDSDGRSAFLVDQWPPKKWLHTKAMASKQMAVAGLAGSGPGEKQGMP